MYGSAIRTQNDQSGCQRVTSCYPLSLGKCPDLCYLSPLRLDFVSLNIFPIAGSMSLAFLVHFL